MLGADDVVVGPLVAPLDVVLPSVGPDDDPSFPPEEVELPSVELLEEEVVGPPDVAPSLPPLVAGADVDGVEDDEPKITICSFKSQKDLFKKTFVCQDLIMFNKCSC